MFDGLIAELDGMAGVDVEALTEPELAELVVRCQRMRARLEAAEAQVLARFDAQGAWRADGARSPEAWLTWRCRLPRPEAGRRFRHARAVRELPAVAKAWAAAEIDRAHVATLLSIRGPRTEEAFLEGHEELLRLARTQRFSDFARACQYWKQCADPDGAEDTAKLQRDAREVHLSESIDGMWFGKLTLDPISGTIVSGTLSPLERELFEADWAEARQRLGHDPTLADLARTPAQRRADALVEMAIRARTAPADGRRPRPLFTVLVDYGSLAGPVRQLWNRTSPVLTPGTIAAWLGEADVERIVFDGRSRVIDVGAQRRFFRGADRRAVEVSGRECYHPTCEEPAEQSQIDHIVEASRGGPTTQANGRPACGFHNRLRNGRPTGPGPGPDPP